MKTETIEINEIKYLIKIYYENRNNSRVSIRKKSINIRIPLVLNREEQFKQLQSMRSWAIKKIKEKPEKFKPEKQKQYKDGDLLKIENEQYQLKINFKEKQNSSARITGNIIHFLISFNLPKEIQNKHISLLLSRCIARKRLPILKEKIYGLNKKHFNQKINKVFFKYNKSNLGSCSNRGNINISTRLLFAPDNVLEYVCVHELPHLIKQNHSNKFWSLVEKAIPDYKEKEQWLKENRDKCRF